MAIRLTNHNSTAVAQIKDIQAELRQFNRGKLDALVRLITDEATMMARALGIEARSAKALCAKVNRERETSEHYDAWVRAFEARRNGKSQPRRDAAWSRFVVLSSIRNLLDDCEDPADAWGSTDWSDVEPMVCPQALDGVLELLELMHAHLPFAMTTPLPSRLATVNPA